MKLKNKDDTRSVASDRRDMPAGPARLLKLLRILENDLSELPLDTNPPASVIEAHSAFTGVVAWAKQTAGQVETAEGASAVAHEADVAAAVKVAEAPGAGKLPEPTRMRKASGAVDAALLNCEAAEERAKNAHAHLTAAVRDAWPEWRRDDVACAEQAHGDLEAALAAALDAARVLVARRAAVLTLDSDTLARDPALKAQVSGERRPNAVAWYAFTHLDYGGLPGVVTALDDLASQVAASHEFAAADWLPPTDPQHAELLAAPADAGSKWLRHMAASETGKTCSVCQRAPAAEPVVIDGQWWTVCPACAKANAAEQDKILAESERQAKTSRRGYPEDPQAGAWRKEKASAAAEDAHAAALGGPDDAGDANAAMIAKHHHIDD